MVVDVRPLDQVPPPLTFPLSDLSPPLQTGKVKETRFEPERGMQLLVEVLTSRAASRQRKGRAGRTKPGKVCLVERRFSDPQLISLHPCLPPVLQGVHAPDGGAQDACLPSAGECVTSRVVSPESAGLPWFRPCTVLRTPLEALFLQVKSMREDEDVKAVRSRSAIFRRVDKVLTLPPERYPSSSCRRPSIRPRSIS